MNSVQDFGYSYRRLLKDSLIEHPFGDRERVITICVTSFIAAVFVFSLFISLFTCFRRQLNLSPASKPPTSSCSSQLTAMPVYIYSDSFSNPSSSNCCTSSFESRNCVICLAEFEHGDELRVLPNCKHEFHKGCIDQWLLLRSLFCPLCRDRTIEEIGTMKRPVCANYWARNPAFILAFGLGSNIPLPSQL